VICVFLFLLMPTARRKCCIFAGGTSFCEMCLMNSVEHVCDDALAVGGRISLLYDLHGSISGRPVRSNSIL
jgi:hypothetical protein